jgi:flagellar hook-associated protein 2
MGTSSSSLSSNSGATSFNGTSQYAGDLQNAINFAVAAASIPLTQLQDNVTLLQTQSSEVSTLHGQFAAIQTAIQNLSSNGGGGAYTATVSDSGVASATVASGSVVSPGTYSLNVIDPGSPSVAISNSSLPAVADPSSSSFSSSSSFTLTVGGATTTISLPPGITTLNALVQAINSSTAGVTANLINVGTPSSPDYQITVQSDALGNVPIQLNDGTQNLLTSLTTGTQAQYQVDGQPSTPISSSSSTVTLAPGVTVDLVGAGQTTVTVGTDASSTSNALSAFVSAYNSALSELNNNHGPTGGVLTGSSLVSQLQQSLQNLMQYTGGSGNVQTLADLGITFTQSGQLSFNQGTFENALSTNPSGVASFLGTGTGSGFLANANNLMNGLDDPNTGLFQNISASYQKQVTAANQEITDQQSRISAMQTTLVAQMSAADSLIAGLESKVTYFTALFQDTNVATQANH